MRLSRGTLVVVLGVVAVVTTACGSGGPYTIEDFYISTGCSGEGTLQIQSVNDKVSTWGSVKVQGSDLRYMAWCDGLIHEWKGTSTLKGYRIESDPGDPLQFGLDKNLGYYYRRGTGTITAPDGKATHFP